MDYSRNEIVDILLVLGEARCNYRAAAILYRLRYPDRRCPNDRQIQRIELRERTLAQRRVRRRRVLEDDMNNPLALTVLTVVAINPHVSTREIQRMTGISYVTVWRILQKHHFHSYHITITQEVTDNDMLLRANFCRWALNRLRQDQLFFNYVLFSDEAMFHRNGQLNRHNCYYWSPYNPHCYHTVDNQHRWTLHVWCGIVNGYLIGPFFFEENLNGERYLQFLQEDFPLLLENVDVNTRLRMWWQHDGAPAHSSRIVTDFLNVTFEENWIGRRGPILWPPRSPDLTSPDFFYGDT